MQPHPSHLRTSVLVSAVVASTCVALAGCGIRSSQKIQLRDAPIARAHWPALPAPSPEGATTRSISVSWGVAEDGAIDGHATFIAHVVSRGSIKALTDHYVRALGIDPATIKDVSKGGGGDMGVASLRAEGGINVSIMPMMGDGEDSRAHQIDIYWEGPADLVPFERARSLGTTLPRGFPVAVLAGHTLEGAELRWVALAKDAADFGTPQSAWYAVRLRATGAPADVARAYRPAFDARVGLTRVTTATRHDGTFANMKGNGTGETIEFVPAGPERYEILWHPADQPEVTPDGGSNGPR